MHRNARLVALAAVTAVIAVACGGGGGTTGGTTGGQKSTAPAATLTKGGVLKIGLNSDVHEALDPAREYYTIGWEFLHCCLTRTLLGFNFKGPDEGGNNLTPDLAVGLPDVSSDGLTYTFKIRQGIHYAPPLQDLTVTAGDFIRAVNREASSATAASYPFYYSVIQGFDDVTNGKATSVSGVSAPDDSTFVVKLSQPAGYFPLTFTLPAMSPIPPNPNDSSAALGIAQGHDQNFGEFLSSTGPYMWKGSDTIDYSKPGKDQSGPAGFQAGKSYVLVRNPSWQPSTDPNRKAYVDEIDVTVGATVPDLQNSIKAGELDTMDQLPNPEGIQSFVTNPDLKPFIHSDATFGTYYINMNLALPPFDDVHVRKAVNWVVDKTGLQRLAGGAILGPVATHIIPNSMLPGLKSYDPYGTPNESGDVTKAKAEMAQSKYDTNKDGLCDAPECKNVLMVIDAADPQPKMQALVQQNLASIGITVNIKPFQTTTMYTKCETATSLIPVCPSEGWYADFADPYAFVTGLFSAASLTPSCCNDSETGATSEQLKKWGYANTTPTPNIDDQLAACIPTQGADRERCYENVDKTLMEQVVPWVPYRFANEVVITSTRVQNYHLDASTGWISLALVALKNGGQ
jgi:peptide/nickel transport system substrate-binding protein